MLKKHKKLVVLVMVLIALIAVYIAVSTSKDPGLSGKLFSLGGQQIEHIEIKNQYGEYAFDLDGGAWIVSENEQQYRTNMEKMNLMLNSLNDFTITRVLDQEIGLYGLEPPAAAVKLKTGQGTEYSFVVGNTTVSSGSAYVKNVEGIVALTPSANVAQFDGSLAAYRDKNVFTVDSENLQQVAYYKDGELSVSLVSDGTNWYLNYPYEAPARSVVTNEILEMLKGWTIAGFPDREQVSASEMGLERAGEALILVDASGNQQTLEFGGTSGSATFVRTGGEDDIVMLYTADIDFSQLTTQSLLFISPLRANIDAINSIEMKIGGKDYIFEVNSGAKTASVNGRLIDYDDFVSVYYKYVLLLADGRDEAGAKEMGAVAQMKTTLMDGQQLSLSIVPRDEQTYFMILSDGTSVYYMDRERLDALLERVAAVTGDTSA